MQIALYLLLTTALALALAALLKPKYKSGLIPVSARLGIVKSIEAVVRLKKTGRDWAGICPFHGGTREDFCVSHEKQFFHCFGCGEHGDYARFYELMSVQMQSNTFIRG